MLAKRIIACLDVRDGKVVKGVQFENHRIMGDIEELAARYSESGIDELVFYDISASPEGRVVSPDWVSRVAHRINIPFCVAGGISSVQQAGRVLHAGADKISVNTPALKNPGLVDELAEQFGSQCVVVGIDSIRHQGEYQVKSHTGDTGTSRFAGRSVPAWVEEVQQRGAGEIVLNCMGSDGVQTGYHISHLQEIREICDVPLIASGGAGTMGHFAEVFSRARVDGALAATVFHSGEMDIAGLKNYLINQGIPIRSVATDDAA